MRPRTFLAVHPIPAGMNRRDLVEVFTRVSQRAHDIGVHAIETFYSIERGQAFALFEAGSEEDVLHAYGRDDLPTPDVFPAERLYTELLDEPRRAR